MLEKIRNNIALVIGGFTIVGGIVGGINTVGRLVDTLSGIDDRVSQLEELVADNEITNQISILYEKIYQLEQVAYNAEYLEERVAYLDANYQNLNQQVNDLEWAFDDYKNREMNNQDSQEYSVQKWEWQDMLKQLERIKTQVENVNSKWWQVDDNTFQIQNLWNESHQH
jgi:predicted  nucleic acid-binding Zn-ribbon protein